MSRAFLFAIVSLGLLVPSAPQAYAATERPKLELRWFVETGSKGVATTQAFPVRIPQTGKRIMVKNPPVASEREILAVNFIPTGQGVYKAVIKFGMGASRNLELTTRANQGRDLVVLYNKRVLYSAKIDTVLSKGIFVLPVVTEAMKKSIEDMVKYNRSERKLDEERR